MYIILIIALASTFLYVNSVISEYMLKKFNEGAKYLQEKIDVQRERFKLIMIGIASICWATYIYF